MTIIKEKELYLNVDEIAGVKIEKKELNYYLIKIYFKGGSVMDLKCNHNEIDDFIKKIERETHKVFL